MGTMTDKLNAILSSKAAIKAAIQAKGVDNVGDVLSDYAGYINSIPSSPWTGHADVEGLTAIGWTAEDIAYYQQYGVNWNEEDDQYHKVPAENIALYGTVTAQTVKNYANILVYCPKIDTSAETDLSGMFYLCFSLAGIPSMDTSNVTDMNNMFSGCASLMYVPHLDTSKVQRFDNMFTSCFSLRNAPSLNMASATNISAMFSNCFSLSSSPNIGAAERASGIFSGCTSLATIKSIDFTEATNGSYNINTFSNCYSLRNLYLTGLKISVDISASAQITKDSLLFIINNSAATSAITITLSADSYAKFNADPDVTAALAAKPLVSLAQASA